MSRTEQGYEFTVQPVDEGRSGPLRHRMLCHHCGDVSAVIDTMSNERAWRAAHVDGKCLEQG